MVNPSKITNFKLSKPRLEERILFWICAAGKNAISSAKGLDRFLTIINGHDNPFQAIRVVGLKKLPKLLKSCGIGCYNNKAAAFWSLANSDINLRTCSAQDLETIKGIGRKTSRCFIMHSRKNARHAGLDVHILSFLRDSGYDAPKITPSSEKEYLRLENIFLKLADKSNLPVAEFDLLIWREYSGR
ncbi:MAG: hypothetical protein DWQ19_11150 [Crenarchaeota archaeon]|nr:MAG: hypothetical protein DWQ19_11150 [Thermoproteota archaeon]